MKNPLLLVPAIALAAAVSASAACRLTEYEQSPRGLPNSASKIASCADVEKLSPEDQRLFSTVRQAIVLVKKDSENLPPGLLDPASNAIDAKARRFLSKGEIILVNQVRAALLAKGILEGA